MSDHSQQSASAPPSQVLPAARWRAAAVGLLGSLLLAGCAASSSQSASSLLNDMLEPWPEGSAPVAEPDAGGCSTAQQCKVVLKALIDSPDRSWIGQRQPPDAYANGTRLFAFRALRKQLTCSELVKAGAELSAATKSLGGPVSSMTPEQVSRTRTLSSEVGIELAKERERRCRT
ncbi:MAG: hypothetical protein J2P50_07100 [Hyphomicrobiaceae bacterium]|nr:hypothetical protein [Hyphomicrobiaceae bacterium]